MARLNMNKIIFPIYKSNGARKVCKAMKQKVETEINRFMRTLENKQAQDGAWRFPLESGLSTDAYMIILLKSLEIEDEHLVTTLAKQIASKQEKNGAWKVFHDEEDGNLSATIEAYYALLYAGYFQENAEQMIAAKKFILSHGGIEEASLLTKVVLAIIGQYPWSNQLIVPVEFILAPSFFPLHFFDLSTYARVHIAPILVLSNLSFTKEMPKRYDPFQQHWKQPQHLNNNEDRTFFKTFLKELKQLPNIPAEIHQIALRRCEQFMLHRIEPDGSLYCYFTSTFLMIFALIALGYQKDHPVIVKAIQSLKALIIHNEKYYFIQETTATVWNTALISDALQTAGVNISNPMIQRANHFLLSHQHYKYGDWAIHNPNTKPGGWGFSDANTMNPDIDDTTAALRALKAASEVDTGYQGAWDRGIEWVLSMQNDDGGWPAFEKNTDKKILTLIPIKGAEYATIDPSSSDLTGRTIEFLGNDAGFTKSHVSIQQAIKWLKKQQEKNGAWQGRWGISYIYGTWAAVTGMIAVGVSRNDPSLKQAIEWLLHIQNPDGGWGESCRSDKEKKYIPLKESTLSQTAWAVDALIAGSKEPTEAINKGIDFIIQAGSKKDWTTNYPTGAALPGDFYFHYHSYRYIWPLLALGHYKKKFLDA